MKVKKVLSLALALVMVFSMIPAQLIASSGLDSKIGSRVTNKIDVSIAGEEAGKYAGCIDVALKLSVQDYLSLSEGSERQITMANQIIKFDPTVLSTVVKTPPTKRGNPNMQDMLDAIAASPNKNVPGSGNWGSAGESVPTYEGATGADIALFSTDTSALGYSTQSEKVFVMINSMYAAGYENWDEVADFEITVAHVYLKPQEGKTLADCRQAIELATDADLSETGVPAVMQGGATIVSSKEESFVPCNVDETITFSPEFYPTVSYTVTFTGIKKADGTAADDVVLTDLSADDEVVAPTPVNYTDGDYDYNFTGWDKEVVSPATADATYTAQYTKQTNDKTALQEEVTADAALDENNYTPETWAPFAAKLSAAQEVLAQENPTKGAIATALNELVAAKAALEAKVTMYDITFVWTTADGAQSQVVSTAEGAVPVPPEGATANYETATTNYTFAGWDKEIVAATAATTYTAQYTPATKVAQLSYKYNTVDGEQTYNTTADYGTEASAYVPEDAKTYNSADGSYTYELTGWSPALGTVSGDQTYTAQYNTVENPADYTAVNNAVAAANEAIAEEGFAQKYTPESQQALIEAVNAVVPGKLAGEQAVVDAMADTITQAINGLTVQQYDVTYLVANQDPVITAYDYGTLAATVEAGAPTAEDYSEGDYDYTFTGWSPAFADVTANATYTAQYNDSFVAADTSALQAAISDATAKRDNGTQWTEDSVNALNAAIAAADQFIGPVAPGRTQQNAIDAAANAVNTAANNLREQGAPVTYTISFQDHDGTPIASDTYAPDAAVTAPADRESYDSQDGNTTYVFAGWQTAGDTTVYPGNAIPNATASVTYTAVYNETTNYADTSALEQAIGAAQTKQSEPNFNDKYANADVFNGLVSDAQALLDGQPLKSEQGTVDQKTADLNRFELTPNTYTVNFVSHAGTTPKVVNYGETPVAPEFDNYSDGDYDYEQTGWDAQIVPATANATYNAVYSSNFVAADYTANDTAVSNANAVLNAENADKIYTEQTLSALQQAVNNNVQSGLGRTQQQAVNDATTAINNALNALENKIYTAEFKVDGQTYASGNYTYGADLIVPQDPTKAADDTYTYTFAGWGAELPATVTDNLEFNAQFTPVYKEYTVTFVANGQNYDVQTLHWGDEVVLPTNPTKDADETYTYNFTGWTPEVVACAGDATYTAGVEPVDINYTIAFVNDDGSPISSNTYHWGDDVTAPADPSKQADETYTYTFAGWDSAVVPCAGNKTYTATYTENYIDYTIKFVADGQDYDVQTLHYGDPITVPATNPTKAPSVSTVYTFTNWTPEVAATVTGDATYTAVFSDSPRLYTITVITKNATDASNVTDTMSVAFADTPELATPATGFIVNGVRYDFTGWDPAVAPVDSEATYTAQYTETPVQGTTYTINFKYAETAEQAESGNYADHSAQYEEGAAVSVPTPANFTTATATYTFTGWDKEVGAATADTVYTAQYDVTPIVNVYEVNFRYGETVSQVEDGHLVDHIQNVEEGAMPVAPTPSDFKDGNTTYTFVGWDKEVVAATGNEVYTAVYNVETVFIPDMTEIEELVERYKQMVKTGQYEQEDLDAVKAYIDDIYDLYDNNEFTSQQEVDEMATQLRLLEDACRKIKSEEKKEEKESSKETKRSYSRTARTGDNASLIVMSIILVSSIGIAFVSIKKRKRDF